jgi:hypothetical protein
MSNENQRPMYFSQIRVDPNNPNVVCLGGVGPTKSVDGGKTRQGLNNMGRHPAMDVASGRRDDCATQAIRVGASKRNLRTVPRSARTSGAAQSAIAGG